MAASDIVMKMGLDTTKFNASAKSSLAMVGGLTAGVAVLAVGLVKAKDALVKYTNAANEQELAERKLINALRNNNVEMSIHRVAAFAAARQAVTNFGDETTMQMLQMLAPLDLSAKAMEGITVAAQDLAGVTGKAAEKELKKFNLAIATGTVSSLEPFIGALSEAERAAFKAGNAQERAGILITKANESIGGSAEAAADVSVQLSNALGDLDQAIGKLVSPEGNGALQLLVKEITALTTYLDSNAASLRGFLGDMASDFLRVSRAIAPAAYAMNLWNAVQRGDVLDVLSGISPGANLVAAMLGPTGVVDQSEQGATGGTGGGGGGGGGGTGRGRGRGARRAQMTGTFTPGISSPLGDPFAGLAGDDRAQVGANLRGGIQGSVAAGMIGGLAGVGGGGAFEGSDTTDLEAMLALQQDSTAAWATWAGAARSAAATVSGALFSVISGQRQMGVEMLAELSTALGQQIFNLGIQQLWQASFEALSGNPVSVARFALAGTAVGVGASMGALGGALAPPGAGAGGGGGAGLGGARASGGGGAGGGGGGTIVINNSYGAVGPSPQEQARELGRIFRAAQRSGIVIQGA